MIFRASKMKTTTYNLSTKSGSDVLTIEMEKDDFWKLVAANQIGTRLLHAELSNRTLKQDNKARHETEVLFSSNIIIDLGIVFYFVYISCLDSVHTVVTNF